MKRFIVAMALAGGIAAADVLPPPPENPIDADCAPFTGVWAQTAPWLSRGGSRSVVFAVGSEKASIVIYQNQDDVLIVSRAADTALSCEATADGETILRFEGQNDAKIELTARMTDETTFTTTREKPYLQPGPPPPDFKGETETTTWVRIAR